MKKLIFTMLALLMTSSAWAYCSFNISGFDVTQEQLGTVIEVPVNAYFGARVDFWEVYFTYPEGLTPVGYRGNEASMFEDIINENGDTIRSGSGISSTADYTWMQAPRGGSCYWYPNGPDGGLEYYGEFKWEAGYYAPMFYLQLEVADYFTGGEIEIKTIPRATTDIRGGTVVENGDNGKTFTTRTSVSCSGAIYTAKPVITFNDEGNGVLNIVVEGEGVMNVAVYEGGTLTEQVEVEEYYEYTVYAEYEPKQVTVTATATADGKLPSREAVASYTLDAIVKPSAPAPIINFETLDNHVQVMAIGEGMVHLYTSEGDEQVGWGACELCLLRSDMDRVVEVFAYSSGNELYSESELTCVQITVAALEPAYDFEVNGIYYHITGNGEVSVIYCMLGQQTYSGNVVIPGSVTHDGVTYTVTGISDNAFAGCSGLLSVTIPATVTTIGQSAFDGCSSLNIITCMATTPPSVANWTFNNCYGATLRVPVEALNAYGTADYWKLFTTIQGYQGCAPGDVNGDGVLDIDDVSMLINIILGNH